MYNIGQNLRFLKRSFFSGFTDQLIFYFVSHLLWGNIISLYLRAGHFPTCCGMMKTLGISQ
jgi:hypothetical protein